MISDDVYDKHGNGVDGDCLKGKNGGKINVTKTIEQQKWSKDGKAGCLFKWPDTLTTCAPSKCTIIL